MTLATKTKPPTETGNMTMQPSYSLFFGMTPNEARPFIRTLFKLINHYVQVAELRGATNKTGYRLQHEQSVCDFVYSYDPKALGFHVQTQFKPGASNELAGRVLTLIGVILAYHELSGKPLQLDTTKSKLYDIKLIEKWGIWGTKQLYKKFPKEFPELAPAPKQPSQSSQSNPAVKF